MLSLWKWQQEQKQRGGYKRHFGGWRNKSPHLLVPGGKEESSKANPQFWNQVTRRIFYEQTWGNDHGGEMARFLGKDREFIFGRSSMIL